MCVLFLEIEVYADTKHLVGAGELVGIVGRGRHAGCAILLVILLVEGLVVGPEITGLHRDFRGDAHLCAKAIGVAARRE